jgi:hypothetical protein
MIKIIKPLIVVGIFAIAVICSLWLKTYASLSEASLMILITLSAIFSILLPNLNQLKSFSITKGELILREVQDSEAAVKKLAAATLELVEASNDGTIFKEDFDSERYQEAVEEIKSLINKK